MKIAHLVDSMDTGGAEILVATLCRLQAGAGHQPQVHCLFRRGSLADTLENEGIPVYTHGPRSQFKISCSLYARFRRELPDVVHCHNATATTLGAPPAKAARIKAVITTRHGLVPPGQFFRRELKFWLAARCCDHVVAVCHTSHHNLEQGPLASRDRIVTIYNSACPASAVPGADAGEVAKRGFTVINVSRLNQEKDHATLLNAIALARPELPDLHLWLVGNGPKMPALREQCRALDLERNVIFLGERQDVGYWLSRADLFVLSSVSEGLPLSLIEAMAAGLPQIVTDVGGMPEVVSLSGAGRIVPRGSPAELAKAILGCAREPEEARRLGDAARRCYQEHFRPERMAQDYDELYRNCRLSRASRA